MQIDRVAAAAAELKPLRVLLTVIAFPFWVLGLAVGLAWVAVTWCYGAIKVGVADAKGRFDSREVS